MNSLRSLQTKNYKLKTTTGFTLIELLVVIAIIGILSAIVLTQLSSARSKGVDAAIISNVQAMQTQFEVDYNSGTYSSAISSASGSVSPNGLNTNSGDTGKTCSFAPNTTYARAVSQIINSYGGVMYCNVGGTNQSTYVVAAQLKANSGNYFCVDNTGATGQNAGTVTNGGITKSGGSTAVTSACP